METDLEYLTTKRDDALGQFNNIVKSHLLPDEELHNALDRVLRVNKQVETMLEVIAVHKGVQEKEKK